MFTGRGMGRAACTAPDLPAGAPTAGAERQRRRRSPLRVLYRDDHLLRTGHLLTLSSLLTSAIGVLYWAVATRTYGPDIIGGSYAAVSAMTLLSGIGQFNLGNVLIRFTPSAGPRLRALVSTSYAAAALGALVAAAVFVLLVPAISPGLAFLHTPRLGAAFALGTAAYAVFALQDGVLTGLRKSGWIVVENGCFALAKIALIIVLARTALRGQGILLSWIGALAAAIFITNVFVFTRLIGRGGVRGPSQTGAPSRAHLPGRRYVAADYLGQLFWITAMSLPPIMILNRLGATQNAYFSLAFLIAHLLHMVGINMGLSLVVEAAWDPRRIERFRHMVKHTGILLTTCVAVLVAAAPLILRVFGTQYAQDGAGLLRLLALSGLPNLVVVAAVSVARARQRMRLVVVVYAAICILVLGLTAVLLPVMGVSGAGAAWLAALTLVAAALLWRRDLWLPRAAPAGCVTPQVTSLEPPAVPAGGVAWTFAGYFARRPLSQPDRLAANLRVRGNTYGAGVFPRRRRRPPEP